MGVKTLVAVRPAAALYAVVKSACAWAAAASAIWIVPLTVGAPVTEVPGLNPRSPLIVVAPVLVTVEAPRTANVLADPRATGDCPLNDRAVVPAGIATPITLEASVTAPGRPNGRPSTMAPVVTVMKAKARMFPLKTDAVPSVAELPTCQNTLAALAPLLKMTCRPEVVVRVDAIWKMNTAVASPWASSVRSPEEISSEEVDL